MASTSRVIGELDVAADAVHRAFGERDRQAAVREVVRAAHEAVLVGSASSNSTSAFSRSRSTRGGAASASGIANICCHSDPPSSSRVSPRRMMSSPASGKAISQPSRVAFEDARPSPPSASDRSRGPRSRCRTTRCRETTGVPRRDAGVADAADALGELPHDLRPLRRAEVEAVGDRDRPSAARRRCCAPPRPRPVCRLRTDRGSSRRGLTSRRHRQRAAGAFHADDRRVALLRAARSCSCARSCRTAPRSSASSRGSARR